MVSPAPTPILSATLQTNLDRLRQLNTQDIQTRWRWQPDETPLSPDQLPAVSAQWPVAPLNERQHIAWPRGRHLLWLYQLITVPTNLYGYPLAGLTLRLGLTWWADDAQIYVNGSLVQTGDLFECFTRLCLAKSVTPGQTFQVAIRLISPGHDDGALVRSHLHYELPDHPDSPEPSFFADELTVLATLEPATQPQMAAAIDQIDWQSLNDAQEIEAERQTVLSHPFQRSLAQIRQSLIPLSAPLQQREVHCVGHAHLDMAWLWPIADTWNAAERTFKSVLALQKDFPELTYTHSSPALFEWLEHNRPELFQQIQQKVAEGSWSIDAGLWIEPEFNIVSGEAIARHILYGQRYCQEKFGHISKIAWLPDSFGFCWQLPQLLTLGGIETFATLKLSWNDTTTFPHQLFWWQSPDGSRILSLMLPPIGSDIDPVKMSAYAHNWENSTGYLASLWLPGMGDHGGGPTRDMLEKAQRWQNSPFFPQLSFTNPVRFIEKLSINALVENTFGNHSQDKELPTWQDELYLELHRGCYTTHADQKQHNRRCEDLLYQAEIFATVAQILVNRPYPRRTLETAWKTLLFNQFHDILPGTSIPEVFIEANQGWNEVYRTAQQVLEDSIRDIVASLSLSKPPHPLAKPILIFNSLSWPRSSMINLQLSKIDLQKHSHWTVYSHDQQPVICQTNSATEQEQIGHHLSFLANLPAVGYQYYWLCPSVAEHSASRTPSTYTLQNNFLTATIDPTTGHIASLIEKSTQRETFSAPGNQLQVFRDQGQYWDAWNIDPDYASQPLATPILTSIQWTATGPIRQQISVFYQLNQSTICQNYILEKDTPFLKIETSIDWQETQVLLKAHFPLTVSSPIVTYEIPFGAITRATHATTAAEKAKWEVSALRWADLSEETFGVSLLTDCKHGFDAGPSHLRLSLLKSPIWPDPNADKGLHHFTYAIYPHPQTWHSARTVHHARELNIAPIVHWAERSTAQSNSDGSHSFLQLHNPNLILSTFKPAEDNSHEYILRCYEAYGESTTTLQVTDSLELEASAKWPRANILEAAMLSDRPAHINPWQIATYHIGIKSP
jgi:alpha-mannosidase